MKTIDTSYIVKETIDAYLEMVLGVMSLRIPQVQDILIKVAPEATIHSSYEHEHFNIDTKRVLSDIKKEGFKDVKLLQNSLGSVNRFFFNGNVGYSLRS